MYKIINIYKYVCVYMFDLNLDIYWGRGENGRGRGNRFQVMLLDKNMLDIKYREFDNLKIKGVSN